MKRSLLSCVSRISRVSTFLAAVAIGTFTPFFASWVGAEETKAVDDKVPVKIELKGHDGCPDSKAFLDEMRARTTMVREPKKGDKGVKTFKVTIKRAEKGSVGEIILPDAPKGEEKQTAKGESCDDVMEDLVMVAALSIDPYATPPKSSMPVIVAPPPASARPVAPSEPPPSFRLQVAAGVAVTGAQAGGALIHVPVYAEVFRTGRELVSPAVRLGFTVAKSSLIDRTGEGLGIASFKWTTVMIDGCPIRIDFASYAFRFRPCAGLEVGRISARGGSVIIPHEDNGLWLGARFLARLLYTHFDPIVLEFQLGLTLPFTRNNFTFDQIAVYKPPAVIPFGVIGLGVRFF